MSQLGKLLCTGPKWTWYKIFTVVVIGKEIGGICAFEWLGTKYFLNSSVTRSRPVALLTSTCTCQLLNHWFSTCLLLSIDQIWFAEKNHLNSRVGFGVTYFGQLILHFPLFVILSHFPIVKPRWNWIVWVGFLQLL